MLLLFVCRSLRRIVVSVQEKWQSETRYVFRVFIRPPARAQAVVAGGRAAFLHLDADSAQSCWDHLTLLCAKSHGFVGPRRVLL